MSNIYFDNAATTKIDQSVINLMNNVMTNNYGNPNSTHSFGRSSRTLVEKARKSIAKEFNVLPSEIFFTSCGTESDNLILISAVKDLGVKRIVTSEIEHKAVLNVVKFLKLTESIKVEFVKVNRKGLIDYKDLNKVLVKTNLKTIVSLMHVNNEIGSVLDLIKTGDICKKHNALFHSDTVQSIGKYRFDLSKLNIDFIVGSAHKFHGPKGIGFLYVNKNLHLNPIITGGSQERNHRGGTENLYGIIGLAKAMELAFSDLESHQKHVEKLKFYMKEELYKIDSRIIFNGETDPNKSLYTVLSVGFPKDICNSMLLFSLDIFGIAASGGSACSSGSTKGSHVLAEIPLLENFQTVRFSLCRYNTIEEVDYTLDKIKSIVLKGK